MTVKKTFWFEARAFVKKQKKGGEALYIEGVANKAVIDRIGDYIPPEAWDLKDFHNLPMIFFNHDRNMPIGKAVSTAIKSDGLHIKAKLSTSDNPEISRIRDLVNEGILSAFSVGFDPIEMEQQDINGKSITVIKKAKLLEVSVVSLPMNQESLFNVTAKALGEMTPEDFKAKVEEEKGNLNVAEEEQEDTPEVAIEEKQVGADGSGLTNNEGANSNSAGSDEMKSLAQGQLSLLGAIVNELKLMNQSLVILQKTPTAEPITISSNEIGDAQTVEAKLAEAATKERVARLDAITRECASILEKHGL